ncbi:MAG: DNA/RNA non-specific endonuclease [Candidatus Rhabdochlamydia sp.]
MNIKKALAPFMCITVGFIGGIFLALHPYFHQALLPPLFPQMPPMIYRKAYTLAYDGKIKSASFVYEKLQHSSLETQGVSFRFKEDPLIPKSLRSTLLDFKGSKFDKGHLCAAAGPDNLEAKKETFYLSNVSPQLPDLNRKLWLKLERYARSLLPLWDHIYVITGPLFLPQTGEKGDRYIRYELIGPHDVAVPSHYFKIIYKVKGKQVYPEAFIMPNTSLLSGQDNLDLQNYKTSLEMIEKNSGILFQRKF